MDLSATPSETDCYVYTDPCVVDILSICGGENADRSKFLKWQTRASDVNTCVNLFGSSPMQPRVGLKDPKVPILMLLDHMESLGWEASYEKIQHQGGAPMKFDARRIVGKRFYLQCLIALPELVGRGAPAFDSVQPVAFYHLMLLGVKGVQPGLGARAYSKALADAKGDALQLRLLDVPAATPVSRRANKRPMVKPEPLVDIGVAGDDDSELEADAPMPLADAEAAAETLASNAEVAGDGEGSEASPIAEMAEIPGAILGVPVAIVQGKRSGGWSYHRRLKVCCPNPAHPGCTKSRSLELLRDSFGPGAAACYLGAWLAKQDLPAAEHRAYRPTPEAMRAFAQEHGS